MKPLPFNSLYTSLYHLGSSLLQQPSNWSPEIYPSSTWSLIFLILNSDHVTALLTDLHWLPNSHRLQPPLLSKNTGLCATWSLLIFQAQLSPFLVCNCALAMLSCSYFHTHICCLLCWAPLSHFSCPFCKTTSNVLLSKRHHCPHSYHPGVGHHMPVLVSYCCYNKPITTNLMA